MMNMWRRVVPLPVTTCCWGAGPPPRVVWRTLTALGALLLHSGVQHLIWSVGGWVWVLQALISAPRPASMRLNAYRCQARGGQHQGSDRLMDRLLSPPGYFHM